MQHRCFPLDLLAKLNCSEPAKDFLKKIKIYKVTVSQVKNTWEVFFLCEKMPNLLLIREIQASLRIIFPQIDKFVLTPKLSKPIEDINAFLQEHWFCLLDLISEIYPSIKGWLVNSTCQLTAKNILTIKIGNKVGLRYLEKRGFKKYLENYLSNFFGIDIFVSLVYDEKIIVQDKNLGNNIKDILNNILEKKDELVCSADSKIKNKMPNNIIYGKGISQPEKAICEILEEEPNVVTSGLVFGIETRELKTGRAILSFSLTDLTDSITCKIIQEGKIIREITERLKNSKQVKVKGTARIDKFSQELVIMPYNIVKIPYKGREDSTKEKRVELHLHTQLSSMDGITPVKELIKQAAQWGHKAIAITDHGVVQAFPEAFEVGQKYNIKIIYGMEGYIFDDRIPQEKKPRNYHCIILVKNMTGLKNLYYLVTQSHLKYYKRVPRIPKSLLEEKREGLILGTACEAGELIRNYLNKKDISTLKEIANFYDFIEIQPLGNNEFLIRENIFTSKEELIKLNQDLYDLGKELNKPVVATGDVHFLNPDDEIFRRILMAGKGFSDADHQPPLYLRTTEEMLGEFSYLGEEASWEVVVQNTNKIADSIEEIRPIPDRLYPPEIEGAEEAIQEMTYATAHELYGKNLPDIVDKRIKKELDSIINNGFSVLYYIAHKLVKKSNEDGYLVGSRGSVGSSLVATLTGITEVNPLKPHYRCPRCKYSEFITDGSYNSGADLPDKSCPRCGEKLKKDGHDIPFEVFLGFNGDKVPDIDLNFSGDYQPRAHKYTEEIFGKDNVFRAGTISTVASKTAYGFVKNYFADRNKFCRTAEINRLVEGCTGIKRTTGQHPGGLMVVPKSVDIHQFTPLQRPADDVKTDTITTHFDYHSISSRLVKLDILGHDDPTVIKMLEDLTGVDAKTIPLDEVKTMSLFSSVEALGVSADELGSMVGTFGIPEFGTKFVRQMLEDTKPSTFSELVRISGFSHGTDVWLNNAQDLIKNGTAKLSEAISARDDIMIYLIQKNVEPSIAFSIMEKVRKGKGVSPENEAIMKKHNVPQWYIESCKKIKYMFPKAHAVAYVMMAFRIAYFKVYYPLAFYATFFTVRADEFDADLICQGKQRIAEVLKDIQEKGRNATQKENRLATVLELSLEMYLRGFGFKKVDLLKSHYKKFLIEEEKLLPPFVALEGVGINAAENIFKAREERYFTSIQDLQTRAKLSKTVIDVLRKHGCLNNLPETDQLALFG